MERVIAWARKYDYALVALAALLLMWGAVSIDQGRVATPQELLAAVCRGVAAIRG